MVHVLKFDFDIGIGIGHPYRYRAQFGLIILPCRQSRMSWAAIMLGARCASSAGICRAAGDSIDRSVGK